MTLSEVIANYRNEHSLSQRQFATHCGLSNGYISMVEKNSNPSTGKPIVPSLPYLKKLAHGMHISVDELLSMCDDMPISIKKPPTETDERSDAIAELSALYSSLSDENKQIVLALAKSLQGK